MKNLIKIAAGAFMLITASTVWAMPPGMPAVPDLEFRPPQGERFTLENGLVVYLMKDNTLPVVHVSALIGVGNANDPAEKIGLGELTAQLLKDGGTKSYTAEEIDKQLEYLGASIESSPYSEETRLDMTVLKKDLGKVLDIYAEVLRNPVFDEQKLKLAKDEDLEMLRRRNDKPNDVLFREAKRMFYGEKHPYGWRKEVATVSAIARADLQAFHAAYYKPNNIIVSVTGDFASNEEMLNTLKAKFSSWEKGAVTKPEIPDFEPKKGRQIYFINKDVAQAFIVIFQKGLGYNSPKEYPLTVLSEILGGGMQSRLMTEVRSKKGLAYTVSTYSGKRTKHGFTYTYCGTKPETYSQALTEILKQLERAGSEPVPQDELKRGKDAIINPFVFKFPTPAKLIAERASEEFYQLKDGYLDNYVSRMRKVSQEDILATAKDIFDTKNALIFVIGNSKKFDKPLSDFGPVTELKED
jgi:predicted Zn-dependent peptidase